MATTKRSSGGTRKSTATRSRTASASKPASGTGSAKARANGRAATAKASSAKTTNAKPKTTRSASGTASRNGAKRSQSGATAKRATTSRNGSSRNGGSARARATRPNGTAETLKRKGTAMLQAADKASGPAVTVAAAVAGLAGGLALRQRGRMVDPGIATRSKNVLRDVDPAAVLEGLGKATVELGKRSKVIARELDQVADRAERFGKILS
jgi:hypothetical protein